MTRLLIATALLAALTVPAAAESRSYYGANGGYAGSSITRNGSTTFTNRNGSYIGSSITRGNSTSFYNRNGSYTGSVINMGPRR
jgi:hypothetical protein